MTTSENHTRVLHEQAHLLDLVLDAIILRDMQGAIIFWNHGAETLYGWTSDEALGKNANTLLHTQFPQPLEAIKAEACVRATGKANSSIPGETARPWW